ncbi:SPW repeat protein [Actinomadura oligospora]|uniref:SPW repeat protein n=1 Tax=Actinomadura oligospora TaxID=111804 RepID=UPI0004792912|nr:SPW repeat protein [Actinomadura oligospora]
MGKLAWEDAVAFVAGLAALVAPDLWTDGDARLPLMVLGALLLVAGLFPLLGSVGPAVWTTTTFALLLFVSPWAWEFTDGRAAAWTAWIAGGAATIVGLWVAYRTRTVKR